MLNFNNFAEGFLKGSLVKTKTGYTPIEQLKEHDLILAYDFKKFDFVENEIINIKKEKFNKFIKLTVNNSILFTSPNQKFYCPLTKYNWIQAKDLKANQFILKNIKELIRISDVKEESFEFEFYSLTIKDNHNFFISLDDIFVHNFVETAATSTFIFALGETAIGATLATVAPPVLFFGSLGLILYDAFFNEKDKKQKDATNEEQNFDEEPDDNNSSNNSPNNNQRKKIAATGITTSLASKYGKKPVEKLKNSIKKLIYEKAPYHNKTGNGRKSRAPINGQDALDKSIDFNGKRRLSIENDEFVVFDKTLNNTYHGHVRPWTKLNEKMQAVLIKMGLVKPNGKIIKWIK